MPLLWSCLLLTRNVCRFVKSTSNAQLRGEAVATSTLYNCEPELYLDGNKSALINPCGLPAWSYFNDTFSVRNNLAGRQ